MFVTKQDGADKAKLQQQGVKRVREWLEELIPHEEKDEEDGGGAPPGKETSVIVNQLACREEGCPDVEVVLTLLRAKPRSKLMFKIYKAAADLSREEVEAALRKAIEEEQQSGAPPDIQEDSHGDHEHKEHSHHDHGHGEGGHDEGCCDHDHHSDAKQEHEHGHGDGAHHEGCCSSDHSDGKHEHDHEKHHDHGHKD